MVVKDSEPQITFQMRIPRSVDLTLVRVYEKFLLLTQVGVSSMQSPYCAMSTSEGRMR